MGRTVAMRQIVVSQIVIRTLILAAVMSGGSTLQAQAQSRPPSNSPAPSPAAPSSATPSPITPNPATPSSRFKTVTLTLQGSPRRITLQHYERIGLPATTYFPATYLTVSGGCTERGCGVGFFGQPDQVNNTEGNFVRFFFPRQDTTVAQLRQLATTGDQSLLRLNPGWTVTETQTTGLEQPWMKEATRFTTPSGSKGRIVLGENAGKAFGFLEIYQQNQESQFLPLFEAIYENLAFKS